MENENKKMMVKFSELQEWVGDDKFMFDLPGMVLLVHPGDDGVAVNAAVNVDALEVNDRKRWKLLSANVGLAHLAGEALKGDPKAVGVVAEWAERYYYEQSKKDFLQGLRVAQGDADTEGE